MTATTVTTQNNNTEVSESVQQIKEKLAKLKSERNSARKPRVSLDDAQRIEVTEKLREGKTVQELAANYNVSQGTVNILKKAAGLVKAHKPKIIVDATPVADATVTQSINQ